MANARIVHITPHLGGGVGRVLSQAAAYRTAHATGIEDSFVCLEAPEKSRFIDIIRNSGAKIMITRSYADVETMLRRADIIQLEWWHHPLMAEWVQHIPRLECRLVIWSHTSGLHYPAFPAGLVALPHAFLMTAGASLAAAGVRENEHIRVIAGSGGFDAAPAAPRCGGKLRYGYIGSLNAAKLHPQIMDFLAAVPDEQFSVAFYGDADAAMPLAETKRARLMGYTQQPALALHAMDIFIYLLNPLHYGTTENALLEAMAAGAVPVVLNNPVESGIVRHGETGLVVDTPAAFADAVHYLETHPKEVERMADAAAADVRRRFSLENTVNGLTECYRRVMAEQKKRFDFSGVLGTTPFNWFYAGLGRYAPLFADGSEQRLRQEGRRYPFLYEKNKSSPFHFLRYFPEDARLRHWAAILNSALHQEAGA